MGRAALLRRTRATAVALAAACAPATWAADVLVLRDGDVRQGSLKSCIGGRCQFDGEAVEQADVAWIGLGRDGAPPTLRASASDQVVRTDGRVVSGRFVGVSLGAVALEGESLDRSEVAWIRLADAGLLGDVVAVPTQPAGIDGVILRDGSVRTGELEGCAGGHCWLAGSPPLARRDIAALVLAGAGEVVPPADLDQDRVLRRDGSARDGAVYGVSSADVVTATGAYPRPEVAAIFLAEPDPEGGEGAVVVPSPEAAAAGVPPAGSGAPSGGGSTAPGAPPGRSTPGAGGRERGALWTGSCQSVFRMVAYDCEHRTEVFDTVRLREYPRPLIRRVTRDGRSATERVGTVIDLMPEGSERTNVYTLRCPEGGASGSGTVTVSALPDDPAHGQPSILYLKTQDVDLTPVLGFDVPRSAGLYYLGVATRFEDRYPVTYRNPGEPPTTEEFSYFPCTGGRSPLLPEAMDPNVRRLEDGRMIGSYSAEFGDGRVTTSWTVCREGDDCSTVPAHEESTDDPCARAGQAQALADTCRAQLDSMVAALEPYFAAYNERMAAAEAHRAAFEDAQRFCRLYDTAQLILETLLTGGGGRAAKLGESLLYLRTVINKTINGDLVSLLYPSEVKKFLEAYGAAQDAWFELTADDLAKMNANLGACAGKVPAATWDAAQDFLAGLAGARDLWKDSVAPRMNDIRSKGLECAYRDHQAWRACLADAACRGVAPNCGPEPTLAGAYDGRQ